MKEEMKEEIKEGKRCPLCRKEYPEKDKYCGDDGSLLEQTEPLAANAITVGA